MQMTKNQKAVLSRLAGADDPLHACDFAEISTVSHGRREWAGPILKSLANAGLAEKLETRTRKGMPWRITDAGRKALKTATVRPTPVSKSLSPTMHNEIISAGRGERDGTPRITLTNRATHEALERRGLITIEYPPDGWRTIRLTTAGAQKYREIIGDEPAISPRDPSPSSEAEG